METCVRFSTAIGYFLFDLGVILWWRLPWWILLVLHHIVATCVYYALQE